MRTHLSAAVALGALLVVGASSTARAQDVPACDRACLEGLVEQFFDAYVAHDPSRLPLTATVRYTENGQRLVPGDGSWRSMVGKGVYRLFVTDVPAGQVAAIATLREQANANPAGSLVLIAVRLRVQDQRIPEIEAFVVRNTQAAARVEALGRPHPRFLQPIPEAQRMSREDLIRTANMYFSGMQRNDGKGEYPFTDDCERFENGSQATNAPTPAGQTRPSPKTANTYSDQWGCREQFESGLIFFVTRIRDRRFVAVDPSRGLVFSFVFFDHSAGDTRRAMAPDGRTITAGPTTPWTWELAELFRIEQGKIRRIEAILERSPYGMGSGWSSWEDQLSDRIQ